MFLKILIVDDDAAMLKLYERIFCGQDYSITLAASVAAASALIKANCYDLLITDLMLGDGLGTELTQLFTKEFPRAKSLIVTGSLAEIAEQDLSGVAECLDKPLRIDSFLEAVTRALAKSSGVACGALQA